MIITLYLKEKITIRNRKKKIKAINLCHIVTGEMTVKRIAKFYPPFLVSKNKTENRASMFSPYTI